MSGSAYKDETLDSFTTIEQQQSDRLWSYLVEGGPENYSNFLKYCHHLIDNTAPKPNSAKPLPKAGIYWPDSTANSAPTNIQELKALWQNNSPVAAITFYRALLQGDDLKPIDALIQALQQQGMNPLPIFATSLKDEIASELIKTIFDEAAPDIVINTTSFAISNPGNKWSSTVLDSPGKPVLQAILSGSNQKNWFENARGLSPRDIAMNIALPEIDGRITSRAISFKADFGRSNAVETNIVGHEPEMNRIDFTSKLASNWVSLANKTANDRRIALILSNYPSTDGRIANGVGLDTPKSTIDMLHAMKDDGYKLDEIPKSGDELIKNLQLATADQKAWPVFSTCDYKTEWETLPKAFKDHVSKRWGTPQESKFYSNERGGFPIRCLLTGNVVIGIQPGRGSGLDAKLSHHDGLIPPPHEYIAFYLWLQRKFKMDAIVHMGKHGNIEWLPGKALALSETCAPEILTGPTPHIYPFIVNDPGEGAQAKRRTSAVIIDHLTPPLTRAETYGPLKNLESLVDEYYEASGLDPRRVKVLSKKILETAELIGIASECGIAPEECENEKLQKLDNFLCELKELQIRDGLHSFGSKLTKSARNNLIVSLTRLPRGDGTGENQSLVRALALDLNLDIDPLITELAAPAEKSKPDALSKISSDTWRTNGDTVERLEILADLLVKEEQTPDPTWQNTKHVLTFINKNLGPMLTSCAVSEKRAFLTALAGNFIEPGPSGAPSRGRLDVLPTGRNFYTIDNRTIPTETAWTLGVKAAENIVKTYTQENGEWPKQIAMSAWGTSNMRTGGDDLAIALRLIGAKPLWDEASRRVTSFEITPLSKLSRPRVDILFRISGFFRDAFGAQLDLLQSAINAVADLDEPAGSNPIAATSLQSVRSLIEQGVPEKEAIRRARKRIFGSAEMQYGAGIKDLIHQGSWQKRSDLANAYIEKSAFTYGQTADGETDGERAADHFKALLKSTNLVIHNQDTREFDILDSEDFYQFEGGLAAAIEDVSGNIPTIYHNDHSNPENPKVQTLDHEIAKIVRGRAANPKWIESIMRHGSAGASEMLATVTNLTAFAALTNSVKPQQFELLFEAYLVDDKVSEFLCEKNKPAMLEMAAIFQDAIERGLWQPKRNSAYSYLTELRSS